MFTIEVHSETKEVFVNSYSSLIRTENKISGKTIGNGHTGEHRAEYLLFISTLLKIIEVLKIPFNGTNYSNYSITTQT